MKRSPKLRTPDHTRLILIQEKYYRPFIDGYIKVNKQFQLKEAEREAVAWAWPQEAGDTMFHMVNTYTRAAAMDRLPAESSYRLQKVGGEVLGMLNLILPPEIAL